MTTPLRMMANEPSIDQNQILLQNATDLLTSLREVLQILPDEKYSGKVKILENGSVGEHTRHIIEFFRCLLLQRLSGVINYEQRKRQRAIEQKTAMAVAAIDCLLQDLPRLGRSKQLHLVTNEMVHSPMYTSIARELHYVIDHTIHHMALIRVGIRYSLPRVILPKEFGFAPATIKYRLQQRAGAIAKETSLPSMENGEFQEFYY